MRKPDGDADIPTGLAGLLRERGASSVAVVGLATDVCVAATAVNAATAGFGTVVLWNATRPVAPDANTTERVLADLAAAGVTGCVTYVAQSDTPPFVTHTSHTTHSNQTVCSYRSCVRVTAWVNVLRVSTVSSRHLFFQIVPSVILPG